MTATSHPRAIGAWLLVSALLVLAMVVVGGATRLTHSGLSITEWQPIVGTIPPLSEADWQAAFAKYQQIPEYKVLNQGMTLAEFKPLFWWEWSHRLLGRLVGVVFLVPMLAFAWLGSIGRGLWPRLIGLFALGGLQGAAGWYMVASGLVDRTDVSQYRLALHLGLAVLILAAIVWTALDVLRGNANGQSRGRWGIALALVILVYIQILLGALVAGLDAGLTYNTWPLMDGRLVPPDAFSLQPWWLSAFEDVPTVQFDHRMVAYAVVVLAVMNVLVVSPTRLTAWVLLVLVLAQVGLGIWTLLEVVPLHLALSHQLLAMLVLLAAVVHLHTVRHSTPPSAMV